MPGINLKTHTTIRVTRKDAAMIRAMRRPGEKAADVVARCLRGVEYAAHLRKVLNVVVKTAKKRQMRGVVGG